MLDGDGYGAPLGNRYSRDPFYPSANVLETLFVILCSFCWQSQVPVSGLWFFLFLRWYRLNSLSFLGLLAPQSGTLLSAGVPSAGLACRTRTRQYDTRRLELLA